MTRNQYAELWRRLLTLTTSGSASLRLQNPAVDFTKKAKSGEYDNLPDDAYADLLQETETAAAVWGGEPYAAAGDVLKNALSRTAVPEHLIADLAGILADCAVHSDWTSEPAAAGGRAPRPDLEAWTPKAIHEYLDRHIRGQDEAKKAASVILWRQLHGRRSNAVFCGSTGCGKTEIFRALSREFPDRIRIADLSRMTADGWRGSSHVRDIFEGLSPDQLQDGMVVCLDEADKITCEHAWGGSGQDYNVLVQNNLLKMLDGDVLEFGAEDRRKPLTVDCSRFSFVLTGSFETLLKDRSQRRRQPLGFSQSETVREEPDSITWEDLIHAGMRREIAGRIGQIVSLRPLTEADYRAILTEHIIPDLQRESRCRVSIPDSLAGRLARQAEAEGLGARWMRAQVENAVNLLLYEDPGRKEYEITETMC